MKKNKKDGGFPEMEVIDLDENLKPLYFVCLEDWSEQIKEGLSHKKSWYERMKDKGLSVKLAKDERGEVGGMIQYLPVENSFIEGKNLYFITCIWIHGHKEGRGNFQKRGMGKALLQAAESDVRSKGAKGIAAWGVSFPFWMKASWFKKQGFRKADKQGMQVLLWKPFDETAVPPKWIREKKAPLPAVGKVTVTAFKNGWCPAQNMVVERAKRAAGEFGEKVIFQEIDTLDKENFSEWGISDGLFIDSKQMGFGPPLSYEKIKKRIAKKVKKLKF